MSIDKDDTETIRKALGAQHVVSLENLPSQGPLDFLALKAELGQRLKSTGGRPTDPEWAIRRLIPFKKDGWAELERLAERCRQGGQNVSPSQLAALLIEHGMEQLKKAV